MAQPATIHGFHLDVSDMDRGLYESIDLRVARHPSETVKNLVLRVLAYALELRPDLSFGRGVSTDEPAISLNDGTGRVLLWIDIGAPSADRLHKATKLAEDIAVYTTRDLTQLATHLQGIHRPQAVRLVHMAEAFINELATHVDRRNDWVVLHSEGTLYVTVGEVTCETTPELRRLG